MNYRFKIILIAVVLFAISSSSNGQRLDDVKIVQKPEKFLLPKKYTGEDRMKFINDKSRKRSDKLWIVVNDRSSNFTFDKPGGAGKKYQELEFGQVFYVIDEDNEWINIGKSDETQNNRKARLEIYGWVQKEKMLLWNNGLLTGNSIHLKAFLLNKLKQVRLNQSLNEAQYYHDPDFEMNGTTPVDVLDLYSFYYIYKIKYDDVGRPRAYLLGRDSKFNPILRSDLLLGWVSTHRIDEWNTRLALAPNFGNNAFPERKKDIENLRARGYEKYQHAVAYSKNIPDTDHNDPGNIIWDEDPVKGMSAYISESDPKRFSTNVIRFPVLKYHKNFHFYKSGVVQEFNFESQSIDKAKVNSERKDLFDSANKELENLNVFFLVDGTNSKMANQVTSLTSLMKSIDSDRSQFKRIRTGIGVYKDCSNPNTHYKRVALSTDVNKTTTFLQNIKWGQEDADEYNCVISAFWESLNKADFDKKATNVIVHLGDQPDIVIRKIRGPDAKKYSSEAKKKEIRQMVSDFHINLISLDIENKNDEASDDFQITHRSFINDLYKKLLEEINLEGMSFKKSFLQDFDDGVTEIQVSNFPYVYSFKIPTSGNALGPNVMSSFVEKKLKEIKINKLKTKVESDKIEKNGLKKQPSSGLLSDEAKHIIRLALKKRNKGLTDEEIYAMLQKADGTSFYSEVFLPSSSKKHGAKHDPWCYVMFLPREDLGNYINQLKKLVNAMELPGDKKRELLQVTLADLAETLTGQQSAKSLKKINIDDIEQLLAGIKDQGLEIEKKFDIKLEDITDTRKFPDNQLNKFQRRISKKVKALEYIYRDNEYEFMYDSGSNKYYWISFAEIF